MPCPTAYLDHHLSVDFRTRKRVDVIASQSVMHPRSLLLVPTREERGHGCTILVRQLGIEIQHRLPVIFQDQLTGDRMFHVIVTGRSTLKSSSASSPAFNLNLLSA